MSDLPSLLFLAVFFPTVAAAGYAITARNLVHAALFLILTFLGVAVAFVILQAEFAATVQVLVYVGAVSVLILFAIMLTRHVTGILTRALVQHWIAGILVAALVFGFMTVAIFHDTIWSMLPYVTDFARDRKTVEPIGTLLMTDYMLPFEVLGILLTAALVGAIVLARSGSDETGGGEK